ncbi:MAG: hypothetical protein AAF719_08400, partial [Pseudomonadota bacterium]
MAVRKRGYGLDGDIWRSLINLLPFEDLTIFGLSLSWPVYLVLPTGALALAWKIFWDVADKTATTKTLTTPPLATKAGQNRTHDKLDDVSGQIAQLREEMLAAAEKDGRPAPDAESFVDAYLALIEDDRGAFAPARQEAIAALDALKENNTVDALAEFERATMAFENSLAQRAAMRADMAREDAEDYRRLGRLTYVSAPLRSLGAYREAAKLDTSDIWALIYLARLEQTHGDGLNAALSVLKTAGSNAANDRDRSV